MAPSAKDEHSFRFKEGLVPVPGSAHPSEKQFSTRLVMLQHGIQPGSFMLPRVSRAQAALVVKEKSLVKGPKNQAASST